MKEHIKARVERIIENSERLIQTAPKTAHFQIKEKLDANQLFSKSLNLETDLNISVVNPLRFLNKRDMQFLSLEERTRFKGTLENLYKSNKRAILALEKSCSFENSLGFRDVNRLYALNSELPELIKKLH